MEICDKAFKVPDNGIPATHAMNRQVSDSRYQQKNRTID